jgi:hypothetical protein
MHSCMCGVFILKKTFKQKSKNCLNNLLNSSVLYFFAIFQPTIFIFWILREDYLSTRNTTGFFDSKPRSSGIELRLGPSQIKVFSYYFIHFWETINVFQLISQGYSKIQIFQKKVSLVALEAAGSGSKLGFNYSHLEKQETGKTGCDLRINCSAWNNFTK